MFRLIKNSLLIYNFSSEENLPTAIIRSHLTKQISAQLRTQIKKDFVHLM